MIRAVPTAILNQPATSRRSYLGWLLGLCGAGVGAVLAVPLIRYAIYPLRATTTETKWSDAGSVSDLATLTKPLSRTVTVEQVDGWRKTISEKAVYVLKNSAGQLQVFSAVCPHLGCSVQWREGQSGFECPCHGATFTADGAKLGGPTPRAMDLLASEIKNGHLMVKYQYFRQLVATKEVIG